MSIAQESSRLAWLAAAWSDQRHRISSLLGRIGDLGVVQGMSPKTFQKFLRMMGQVAAAKDEEVKIISAIEAIEQKHRFFRKRGFIRRVGPKKNDLLEYEPSCIERNNTPEAAFTPEEDYNFMPGYVATYEPRQPQQRNLAEVAGHLVFADAPRDKPEIARPYRWLSLSSHLIFTITACRTYVASQQKMLG